MKKQHFSGILLMLMLLLMFIPVSAAAPENKMNVAVICGTDDARKSTQKMQKVLAKNKLPHWRLNKQIPYYYDCSDRPATHSSVNQILDQAFGDSTENDINYLFFAAHGYPGTNDPNQVIFANTGLILDLANSAEKGVYKFTDFVKKLTQYKGQFVIIIDSCFSQNFITTGLAAYPEYAGRFTVFCSASKKEYAWGALGTQFYTSNMVNALTYKRSQKKCPADKDKDGFITVNELHKSVIWKELSSIHTYGAKSSQLFQFGYVKLFKKTATINLADTKTCSLGNSVKKYNCTSKQAVKWKSDNPSVATVSKNGKVTAKEAGTAIITAYLADENGAMCLGSEATCKITVKKPKIKLSRTSVTLYEGQTTKLTAKVTGTKKKPSWKSSNSSVASIKNGKITARKTGTATVTAKIGTVSASCKVTVKKPTITLNRASASLLKNKTLTLKATVKGKSQKVTWSTSNKKIAAVNQKGKVTAKKAGTVTITAKANGVTAKCKITVKEKTVERVRLNTSYSASRESYQLLGQTKEGRTVWTFTTGKNYIAMQVDNIEYGTYKDYVYVLEDFYFYKLDKETGKILKKTKVSAPGSSCIYIDTQGTLYAVPFLGDDIIYVISGDGVQQKAIPFDSQGNGGASISGKSGNYLKVYLEFGDKTIYVPVS